MEHAPAWLVNSLIYLSAAVIAVPLSRALGLGSIIGYLAAGMAIGPWGIGLVSNVQDILHFAEFGVVLMLFLVGLELGERKVMRVQRELFESSLASARSVLELLCHSAQDALETATIFRTHNLALFKKLHPHYKDQAKLIAVVKQGRQQLEEQMAQERAQRSGKAP